MTSKSVLKGTFWIVALAGAHLGWAQSGPTLTIDPAGENARVHLSPLDPEAESSFAKTFQIPMFGEYKRYALLLTNQSGQPIIALTIRWTITAGDRTGVYVSRTDNFGLMSPSGSGSSVRASLPLPGQPPQPRPMAPIGESYGSAQGVVAAVGERVLVAPGLFVRESVARQRGSPGSAAGLQEAFRSATSISASVDTVILQDGEVLGPDTSHTVDAVKANKAAINALLDAVRTAEQNGQDGAAALREVANTRPTRDSSGPSLQQRMLARRLMSSPNWKAQLEKMAAIPLPDFHR